MKRLVGLAAVFLLLIYGGTIWAQEEAPLTLEECIGIALEGNFQVKSAEYALQRSDAQVTVSKAGILPSLSLSASSGRYFSGKVQDFRDAPTSYETFWLPLPVYTDSSFSTRTGDYIAYPVTGQPTSYTSVKVTQPYFTRDSHSLGFTLNQNIYDGGRWWNRISQAKSIRESELKNLESARNQAVYSVTWRYFELAKAKELLKVYKEAVRLSEEQLEMTESQFELGAVARTDVYKAKVRLGNDRSNLLWQDNTVITAITNLNIAMGRDPMIPTSIVEKEYDMPQVPTVEEAVRSAESRNPDLQRSEAELGTAKLGTKIAKGAFLPSLGASVRYSRSNEDIAKVYTDYSQNWNATMGIGVSFNIFNGFSDKANAESAEAQYLSAREYMHDTRRRVMAGIEDAITRLNAYRQLEDINRENQQSATEDLRLATERYRLGSGTLLEVQDAQVALTRANATLVSTRYNSLIAKAALENTMGISRE